MSRKAASSSRLPAAAPGTRRQAAPARPRAPPAPHSGLSSPAPARGASSSSLARATAPPASPPLPWHAAAGPRSAEAARRGLFTAAGCEEGGVGRRRGGGAERGGGRPSVRSSRGTSSCSQLQPSRGAVHTAGYRGASSCIASRGCSARSCSSAAKGRLAPQPSARIARWTATRRRTAPRSRPSLLEPGERSCASRGVSCSSPNLA